MGMRTYSTLDNEILQAPVTAVESTLCSKLKIHSRALLLVKDYYTYHFFYKFCISECVQNSSAFSSYMEHNQ